MDFSIRYRPFATRCFFYSLFATHYLLRCSRWNYGGVEIVRKV
jgi:hypothetical protein